MSVRSRLAAAPWPVWSLLGLLGFLLTCWPLLRDSSLAAGSLLVWAVAGLPVLHAVDDGQRRRRTGWDRRRRLQIVGDARRCNLPDDAADRARLQALVERDLRERRGIVWVIAIGFAGLIAFLIFRSHDRSSAWTVAGTGWYVVLGVLTIRLELRTRGAAAGARPAGRRAGPGGTRPVWRGPVTAASRRPPTAPGPPPSTRRSGPWSPTRARTGSRRRSGG